MSLINQKDSFMKEWMGECKPKMMAITLVRLQLDTHLSLRQRRETGSKNLKRGLKLIKT